MRPPPQVRLWYGGIPLLIVIAITAQAARANAVPKAKGGTSTPVVIASWAMNDGSDGVMTDSSPFNNDGSLQNVATGQGAYGFPRSSGQTSRVVVPDDPSLNPDDRKFVVRLHAVFDAWPTGSVRDFDLIRKGQSADGRDWKVEIMSDGRARCYAKGSDGHKSLLSAKPLAKGSWHTIECTFTTNGLTIAVDGTSPKTSSGSIGSVSNTARLSIAAKV